MRFLLLFFFFVFSAEAESLKIGSKKFTESVTLGEIIRLSAMSNGTEAEHIRELGGSQLLWSALLNSDIDLYVEYTGTLLEEILKEKKDLNGMREALAQKGIGMSAPLGFNNTYAVGMLESRAAKLGIKTISDLNRNSKLKLGWGNEFMERKDGWPGLRRIYNLKHRNVQGLDHDVGYRALAQGQIDVIDLYSTDAEIPYYKIRTLEDNRKFFPDYQAVILYRLDKEETVRPVMTLLEGSISDELMSQMNKAVKIDNRGSTLVASEYLTSHHAMNISVKKITLKDRLLKRSVEHFKLVGLSLLMAILVAIPLGIVAVKFPLPGKIILTFVSTVQTIPALALLVMLIKPLSMMGLSGIGDTPALIALFLYSLLPIVRNTHSGLMQIPKELQETSRVLGLSAKTRLLKVELPLALPLILAGIKTSLVLNIGFATLGALIGAGGYGQSILTGIRLDNYNLILEGAIPAALLALIAQKGFDYVERVIVSPGLR